VLQPGKKFLKRTECCGVFSKLKDTPTDFSTPYTDENLDVSPVTLCDNSIEYSMCE
jgi:hypothetical protein